MKNQIKKLKLHSTRSKLLVAFILMTSFSLISVGILSSLNVYKQTQVDYLERINQSTAQMEALINRYISETEQDVEYFTQLDLIQEADSRITTYVDQKGTDGLIQMKPLDGDPYQTEVYRMFETYLKTHPAIFTCSLGVEENGGFIQYPARDRYDGYDARTRDWYKQAVANPDQVTFSDAYVTSTGQWVIYVVKAVFDDAGKLRGVITIDMNLTDLSSMLSDFAIGEDGFILVTDHSGNIIANTHNMEQIGYNIQSLGIEDLKNVNFLESMGELQLEAKQMTLNEGQSYWVKVTPATNEGIKLYYMTFVNQGLFRQSGDVVSNIIVFAVVLFTFIAVIIAFYLSEKIAHPINEITEHARRIAQLDVKHDVDTKMVMRKDEVGLLAESLQSIIINLRHFIQKVSDNAEELEEKIEQRTGELEQAMNALLETEKFAFLGELVGGVAHEINTPIGVSVTTASYLEELNRKNTQLLMDGKMSKEGLKHFFDELDEGLVILNNNLHRAVELITSFKQIAVDQSVEIEDQFNLKEHLQMVITSLKHEYKNSHHEIVVICPEELVIKSFPGVFSQIFSNLIMNSIIHGFEDRTNGKIVIEIRREHDGLYITYRDNGKGIPSEYLAKIYDAFFTTNKHNGGSGLGMNIVYNLVTHKLKGKITCESEVGKGTQFFIYLGKDF